METFKPSIEVMGNVTLLRAEGFIDAHTAPQLEKVLNDLQAQRRWRVVMDFQGMEYISSAGLGVLMGAIAAFRENQGDLKLVQLPPKVLKVFDLLGFTRLFKIYDSLDDAVAAFNAMQSNKPE